MFLKKFFFLLLIFLIIGYVVKCSGPFKDTPGFKISDVESFDIQKTSGKSKLSFVKLKDSSANYDDPIYFVELEGDRKTMGSDFSVLVGQQVIDAYDTVLQKAGINFLQKKAIEAFADDQWTHWLSKQVPSQYLEEIKGMTEMSTKLNLKENVGSIISRVIVLANLPSDLPEDFYPILEDEANHSQITASSSKSIIINFIELFRETFLSKKKTKSCSMMSCWGSRTQDGQIFSYRNLDYAPDTGVNKWKSVTVWKPTDGSHAHAAFGFLPLYGVLSGFSSQGLTVHEANLEENIETFRGFPWVLRLRYIMENSKSINDASGLWNATNNTVGYNHMIASSYSNTFENNKHPAVVMETRAFYSAFFHDNDPREHTTYTSVNKNNQQKSYIQYGQGMNEAVYRTNHGYDEKTLANYQWWGYSAWRWSMDRYNFTVNALNYYEQESIKIDYLEAINITSIVGDKGHSSPYKCERSAYTDATNILSVTHQPRANISYAAWENGAGDTWTPAGCSTYVKFDFTNIW